MFMKRVAQALRRQDWTAVVIEFFMVVLGVLLAFQISEWASGRNEERIRKESLDRLLGEAEQDVFVLREMVRFQNEVVLDKMLVAAANMTNPAPPAAIRRKMVDGISNSAIMPKPPAPDTVYQELIASGRFSSIGDVKMRDAVSNYASSMKYLEQSIDYGRMGMSQPLNSDAIHAYYDPTASRHRRMEIDFASLAADEALQKLFLTRLSNQQFVLGNFEDSMEMAEKMCAEVARVAGRPCKPRPTGAKIDDR